MPKPTSELPDNQVTPNPNLEKRTRRYFSPEYKQRILAQAGACRHGELGELLRREKLFSSQLTSWRKERDAGGGLDKSAPGPRATRSPEAKRIEQLERENARLNKKLAITEDCVEHQKIGSSRFSGNKVAFLSRKAGR